MARGIDYPAEFEVGHVNEHGLAEIWSCAPHVAHTIRVLWDSGVTPVVSVKPANRDPITGKFLPIPVHSCKGHLEDWPVS